MTDKQFEEQLQLAASIVRSWPSWKQTSLQVTAMATTRAGTASEKSAVNSAEASSLDQPSNSSDQHSR